MHIFDSYEIVDKMNSSILWTAAILTLIAAASAVWNAIKESKLTKTTSITFATLAAITSAIGVYFTDHLSDLQKIKETKHLTRLANMSSTINNLASDNKSLEKQVIDSTNKLNSNLRPTKRVDVSLSDKTEYLPKSGVISYVKVDNSANKVIIKPRTKGQTVWGLPFVELTGQGETITLELSGNDWIRKQ